MVCLQQLCAKDPRVFISAAFLQRMWIPLLYLRLLQIFNPNRFFFKESCKIKDLPQLVSYFELGEETESLTTLLL